MDSISINVSREDIGFQYRSIKSLLNKFSQLEENKTKLNYFEVELDFKEGDYHELTGALVWRLMRHYQSLPCKKKIKYPAHARQELDNRRFLDLLTGRSSGKTVDAKSPFDFETFEPFRGSKINDESVTVEDVYQKAIQQTLSVENEFHAEISNNIYEIINNVFDHSEHQKEAGIVCVKSESDILSLCAVDMGQGIKSSFMSNPYLGQDYSKMSDENMIELATKFRETCNPKDARNPNYKETSNGGIGLYYLRQFSKMHKHGQLVILSKKGYYYADSVGRETKRNFLNVEWPGVLVFFRIDLNQELNPDYIDLVQSV